MLSSAEQLLSVSSLDLSVVVDKISPGKEGQEETVALFQTSPSSVQGS